MTNLRGGEVGRRAEAVFRLGATSALSDGDLLARFAGGDAEAAPSAFEALVERHGPMVLRVARGALGDAHSAEDAFQATFLVLARRARSIRDRESVASWLHGVALRVASHARAAEGRRRRAERSAIRPDVGARRLGDDPGPEVHEAIGHLPGWLRAPVVLCYLEGHTCEDAARLLRRPVGTIKSRLSRARDRLRRRLARLDPSLGSFCLGGSKPIPGRLAGGTARAASGLGTPTPGVVFLAEGVLKAMMIARVQIAAVALTTAVGFVFAGGSLAARSPKAQDPPEAEKPAAPAQAEPAGPDVSHDPYTPRDLAVAAGRGTAPMYVLDSKGDRVIEEAAAGRGKIWKEAGRDLRWVVLTGTLDNQGIRLNEARSRNIEMAASHPDYRRVEVERQARRPGGEWSGWSGIDTARIYQVLDNLPRITPEPRFGPFISGALVDPLPVLKAGEWRGVVPEAVLKIAPPVLDPDPIGGGKFDRDRPVLMVRSLDFTVEPGMSYRYRARIVWRLLEGPDKIEIIAGPWSGPTGEVAGPD